MVGGIISKSRMIESKKQSISHDNKATVTNGCKAGKLDRNNSESAVKVK